MKKQFFFALVTAILLSTLRVGAQSIVGVWESVAPGEPQSDETGVVYRYTFNDDGTFLEEINGSPAKGMPVKMNSSYRAEGKYKVTRSGKRLRRRIKPSTIQMGSDNKAADITMKVVKPLMQLDALRTLEFIRIVSLTDDRLVLLERESDSDGDEIAVQRAYYRVRQ